MFFAVKRMPWIIFISCYDLNILQFIEDFSYLQVWLRIQEYVIYFEILYLPCCENNIVLCFQDNFRLLSKE